MSNQTLKKSSAILAKLLETPDDENLRASLQKSNENLYNFFLLKESLDKGNTADLQGLSEAKNEFVKYLATYHLGSFERDFALLDKSDKYALGDLAKLESAYIMIQNGKISDAKNILNTIPQDSQLIEIAKILVHSSITKKEAKNLVQDSIKSGGESSADSKDLKDSSVQDSKDSNANPQDSKGRIQMILARFFALIIIAIVFFSACSEKRYFEPNKDAIKGTFEIDSKLDDNILQSNKNGAVLENGTLITKDGKFSANLAKNYLFLNATKDNIIVADYSNNNVHFLSTDGKILKSFEFEFMPLSASVRDNILAVILANNSAILWDINTNEELFSSKGGSVYAINSKNASPYFLDSTIILPTLDGKLLVVNLNAYKILRTITLGSGNYFGNIIYLSVDGENLIVATNSKVSTIISGKEFSYAVNINDILYKDGKIYILSLEGEVIMLDLLLNELHKKKFPFATLNAIIVSDYIYTLESQGFLIKINPQDFSDEIYKIDISEYKNSFYTDSVIYYDNRAIKVK